MQTEKGGSYRAVLVGGSPQIRFSLVVLGISFLFVTILSGYFLFSVDASLGLLRVVSESEKGAMPLDSSLLIDEALLLLGVLVVFLLSLFLLVLERTRRIYGPIVAIRRLVTELERGNFSARAKVRRGDEFEDLANQLNGLAKELENRFGFSSN